MTFLFALFDILRILPSDLLRVEALPFLVDWLRRQSAPLSRTFFVAELPCLDLGPRTEADRLMGLPFAA